MVRFCISASCVGDFVKTETGIINTEKILSDFDPPCGNTSISTTQKSIRLITVSFVSMPQHNSMSWTGLPRTWNFIEQY